MIWFYLPIQKSVFFDGTVTVHSPAELIRPIMMSVGFRAEDWNSRSTVHFNMFLKCSNRIFCDARVVSKVKPGVNTKYQSVAIFFILESYCV